MTGLSWKECKKMSKKLRMTMKTAMTFEEGIAELFELWGMQFAFGHNQSPIHEAFLQMA